MVKYLKVFPLKQKIREDVWYLLDKKGVAIFPLPPRGRIPNFKGSDKACKRLLDLEEFKNAKCVFSAPDYVLKDARKIVLKEGKKLALATPHMKEFLEISNVREIDKAVLIKNFKKYGKNLKSKVDLFIQGSVAVDLEGNRLGKGSGYGDKEYRFLKKKKLINSDCKIVTIVHPLQIVDNVPSEEHDVKVNYILTPNKMIVCK